MNIDDLKDAWNQDEPQGMQIPVSTATFGKTQSAVSRIRRNMRNEFIGSLIAYGALIALLFYGVKSALAFNTAGIFVFIILVLNSFYYLRFYVFYKSIGGNDFNIQNNIRKVTYDVALNIEIYKTYNFCITPLAALVGFVLLCGKNGADYIRHIVNTDTFISPGSLLLTFLIILISFAVTYLCVNYHIKTQYGKYLAELKMVMDDLDREG